MSDQIMWFSQVGLADVPRVGGKGASLGELEQAGISVPPGFVVTTEAFRAHISRVDAASAITSRVEAIDHTKPDEVDALSRDLAKLIVESPLDLGFADELSRAYGSLGSGRSPVAVRSSATSEDSADASFAGLQDTLLWMQDIDQIKAALLQCWASLYSVPSITYRRRLGLPEHDVAMAVVIQQMVDPTCAGVMFTRSPTTGDRSIISIEAAWGLGSSLVSGEVTPDKITVNKITREITAHVVSAKTVMHSPKSEGGVAVRAVPAHLQSAPCLRPEVVPALCEIAMKAEKLYRCPVDIEWAIETSPDGSHRIYLLQSRPETVWSAKDKEAPKLDVGKSAFSHVMNIYTGKAL